MKVKLIVAGGRDFNNFNLQKIELLKFIHNELRIPFSQILIIEGGARGADRGGRRFAEGCGIKFKTMEAERSNALYLFLGRAE
jgi:hypothetical protein